MLFISYCSISILNVRQNIVFKLEVQTFYTEIIFYLSLEYTFVKVSYILGTLGCDNLVSAQQREPDVNAENPDTLFK